jgi:hypothetical protein
VRKQKTDRRDAAHILRLLMEDRFPTFMASESSGARPSPVTDSSPLAGWDPYAIEERVAAPDAEPGCGSSLPSGDFVCTSSHLIIPRNRSLHPGVAAAGFSMYLFVAFRAQSDQVLFFVAARMAAEFEMVYLQIPHATADLAAPAVALQYPTV